MWNFGAWSRIESNLHKFKMAFIINFKVENFRTKFWNGKKCFCFFQKITCVNWYGFFMWIKVSKEMKMQWNYAFSYSNFTSKTFTWENLFGSFKVTFRVEFFDIKSKCRFYHEFSFFLSQLWYGHISLWKKIFVIEIKFLL